MLPEGMRYASKKKARMKRNIRIALPIPFTFSQTETRDARAPPFPARTAATTLDDFLGFFELLATAEW